MDDFGLGEGEGSGFLDGKELTGIGVVFNVGVGFDYERVAADPAETPAGHIEAFGKRMEFDCDVDGTWGLEDG